MKIQYGLRCKSVQKSVVVKLNKTAAQLKQERKKWFNQLIGKGISFLILNNSSNVTVALSFANQDDLVFNDMDVDHTNGELQDGWEDIEGDAGLYVLPPGEEGMLHSHARGEIAFQQIFKSIQSQYVFFLHFYFSTFLFITESEVTYIHRWIEYNSMSMLGDSNCFYW